MKSEFQISKTLDTDHWSLTTFYPQGGFMNWKLILTTAVIAGIISIPLQVYGIFLSAMSNYGNIALNFIILLVLALILAAVTFGIIYSKAESNRLGQALMTVFLTFLIGFVISLIGVRIFFKTS